MTNPAGWTYTEQYRHECEVRFVLAMPTRVERAAYLDSLQRWRSPENIERLRQDVAAAWRDRHSEGNTRPNSPSDEEARCAPASVHPPTIEVNTMPLPGFGSFHASAHAGNSDPVGGVVSGACA